MHSPLLKKIGIALHEFNFTFPTTHTPEWSEKVDRWYQLDAASFGLTEAVWSWAKLGFTLGNSILLASPGASNESDSAFATQGADSAQKFAHTLANVRISPVAQALNWNGPMLCIQRDPYTLGAGLMEASVLVRPTEAVSLLSVCLVSQQEGKLNYQVRGLEIIDATHYKMPFFSIELDWASDLNRPDTEVWNWLKLAEQGIVLK